MSLFRIFFRLEIATDLSVGQTTTLDKFQQKFSQELQQIRNYDLA